MSAGKGDSEAGNINGSPFYAMCFKMLPACKGRLNNLVIARWLRLD